MRDEFTIKRFLCANGLHLSAFAKLGSNRIGPWLPFRLMLLLCRLAFICLFFPRWPFCFHTMCYLNGNCRCTACVCFWTGPWFLQWSCHTVVLPQMKLQCQLKACRQLVRTARLDCHSPDSE
ncbi:hypothetical protein BO71DRAFT_197352 [Aspergillus ellipticus CBS 707.79]|uniref:Uncharacterized protein n=1 Tax=Aspergillus ellipticus CBS 707.79 TaxID=1448320 RepID=A0A319DWI1_9EURO|nr:hypothetical protein BO71DRAFT_197352 [Aspergillus ellipticus CBS 707.79]